jgi:hypothetical protein
MFEDEAVNNTGTKKKRKAEEGEVKESEIPLPNPEETINTAEAMQNLAKRLLENELISIDQYMAFEEKSDVSALHTLIKSWWENDKEGKRSAESPLLKNLELDKEKYPNATTSPFRLDNFVLLMGQHQELTVEYIKDMFQKGMKIPLDSERQSVAYPNPEPVDSEAREALNNGVKEDFLLGWISRRCGTEHAFVSNPIYVIPKKSFGRAVYKLGKKKFRRIENPSKKKRGFKSINEGIADENVTLVYTSVEEACHDILRRKRDTGEEIYLSKFDLSAAYRTIPLREEQIGLLGFSLDGVEYVETRCPFERLIH